MSLSACLSVLMSARLKAHGIIFLIKLRSWLNISDTGFTGCICVYMYVCVRVYTVLYSEATWFIFVSEHYSGTCLKWAADEHSLQPPGEKG